MLAVEGLSTFGKLNDASFSLRAGEILGVAGLQGMGQLDLFLACFGMVDLPRGVCELTAGRSSSLRPRTRCAPISASASCRKTARPRRSL